MIDRNIDIESLITPTPCDKNYLPAYLFNKRYNEIAEAHPQKEILHIALKDTIGNTSRFKLALVPQGSSMATNTQLYVDRFVKFLLWAQGGHELYLAGPLKICQKVAKDYSTLGSRGFDSELMTKVYGGFSVIQCHEKELPNPSSNQAKIGGHLEGCRIGFDLGASDYKIAAVQDGNVLFSTEIPWTPVTESDPEYHIQKINEGLQIARDHLPRLDAIGGSSAGIIMNNQIKVASLFRAVPAKLFKEKVTNIFSRLQSEWQVPITVVNDGDVTALAGAMSLNCHSILGLAMGSSEAVGYINAQGQITGMLNELAFAPVDYNTRAAQDEWSKDFGVGALYFSQQAVNKLALYEKMALPAEMPLPERLKLIQDKANAEDGNALKIFESIGFYLGHTIPHYGDFYDLQNLLILGRVTSGLGGETILQVARQTLAQQYPDLNEKIKIHIPDEKFKRVGQAVAAASLPALED